MVQSVRKMTSLRDSTFSKRCNLVVPQGLLFRKVSCPRKGHLDRQKTSCPFVCLYGFFRDFKSSVEVVRAPSGSVTDPCQPRLNFKKCVTLILGIFSGPKLLSVRARDRSFQGPSFRTSFFGKCTKKYIFSRYMLIGLFPDCSKRTKRVAEPSAGKSIILDRLEHLFGDTSLTLLDFCY